MASSGNLDGSSEMLVLALSLASFRDTSARRTIANEAIWYSILPNYYNLFATAEASWSW